MSELRWDCRRLKSSIREVGQIGDLASLVREVVGVRRLDGADWPQRFFEVELKGVIRHRNDRLLSATVVREYLSQVAPVPFSPSFRFGAEISTRLGKHVSLGNLDIWIGGMDTPVTRPHSNLIEVGDGRFDPIRGVEFKEIPALDGQIAAIAWFLHHGYLGAIPAKALIKGLRIRAGNVQVGDNSLLEDLFAESRFNAWSVGEIHVLDKRIVPNGRRDQFEQSVHYDNLLNHLGPAARDFSRRCRTSSAERKLIRDFQVQETAAKEKLAIVGQGSLTKLRQEKLVRDIERHVFAMEKMAEQILPSENADRNLRTVVARLKARLRKPVVTSEDNRFGTLPKKKREMYGHFFDLIYECSTNRVAAKALVDRILLKVS